MNIGSKIKELRKSQGITLVELSAKSGVRVATLSRMENLKMTGTVESHISIAKALGTDITQLYSGAIIEEDLPEVKTAKTSTDVFIHSDKSSYEILTGKLLNKKMMPILLKIEPDGQTNKEQNPAGSERFVYVLEGKIEIHIADRTYPLSKGHSLYFNASIEHWFANTGKSTARIISVITPVSL